LVNIGIITDKFHLEHKISEFLKYLKTKAKVTIYIEESCILGSNYLKTDKDLFFVKGKGKIIIALARLIENETTIPVINSPRAILLTMNRFLNSTLLQKEGIKIPDFSFIPYDYPPPFEDFIVKNIIDQKKYKFRPLIKKNNGHINVFDERAINEVDNEKENYRYFYYQKFIKSKWEYKVYGFGEDLFFYKQIPILVNPNKMETRKKIDEIQELKEMSLKAMKIIDLKAASLDFLKSKSGEYFLTDVNSLPNFNYIENGYKKFADFLISQAKK